MPSPRPEKNDVAIAQKAICLARGLSGADKAVAAAILDHFNKRTGQCDPSNARLAALLGIDPTTVRRATAALSSQYGLFIKRSHGGKSCRASYTPVWSAFKAIVDEWERRMRRINDPGNDDENRAEMPGSEEAGTGQKCPPNRAELPVKPGKNALQTHLKNPSYEPITPNPPSEGDAESLDRSSFRAPLQGLWNGKIGADRPPGYETAERAATNGSSRSDAAWQAAQRRVNAAIASADQTWRQELWLVVEPSQMDHAIRSEIRRRGEGVAVLDAAMRLARLSAGEAGYVH